MATIPTLNAWLESTKLGWNHPRSSEMKAIDKAIDTYWKGGGGASPAVATNLRNIRLALEAWKKTKGGAWESSDRNKPPAKPISALDQALKSATSGGLSSEEKAALDYIAQDRERRIRQVFAHAQINLRIMDVQHQIRTVSAELKAAVDANYAGDKEKAKRNQKQAVLHAKAYQTGNQKIVKEVKQVKTATTQAVTEVGNLGKESAKEAAKAAFSSQINEIRAALTELFGEPVRDVMAFLRNLLMENGMSSLLDVAEKIADMLPLLSLISGGVKALASAGKAVYRAYQQYSFGTHAIAIEPGAPAKAFEAVQTLLKRDTMDALAKAAIDGAQFAANAALTAAHGVGSALSPVVSAAGAAANAIRVITMFAVKIRETLRIRRLLRSPEKLDASVFQKAPLMGAYMLVCSNTSDIVAFWYETFGAQGWMDSVEEMVKKHIDPVLDTCQRYIQASPFIITGVPLHRSAYGNSLATKGLAKVAGKFV